MPHAAASLCVPVEISRPVRPGEPPAGALPSSSGRWFRLALSVSADRIELRGPLPRELGDGPLCARLQLPPPTERLAPLGADWDADAEIVVYARAGEVRVHVGTERERAELRVLHLENVSDEARAAIARYVELRADAG